MYNKEFFPDYHNLKGIKYYKHGEMIEAIKSFKKAIKLNNTYIEAYINLGVTYSDCGLKDEAVKAFEKAYMLDPNYLDKYGLKVAKRQDEANKLKQISLDFFKRNEFERALSEINKAISLKNTYADLYNLKGVILIKLKRFEEAKETLKKALEINPEYETAKSNLALVYYYQGLLYFETGLEHEAIREWKRSIILDPVHSMVKLHLNKGEDKITMKITCPICKEILNTDWNYCPYCGSKRRGD